MKCKECGYPYLPKNGKCPECGDSSETIDSKFNSSVVLIIFIIFILVGISKGCK